ncbi:MAG TPA: rubrerythrin family protein [Saprospiraceae bacterium]|nr:rubrerythrin family protein [Saprospiraceae bacterium]HPN69528.1 rubrerythrin family protein [Saprospiraceae bacterium]
MKKITLIYSLLTVGFGFILMSSCEKKMELVKATTKEHMDAGTKTIENMQSAYKGEKTATAKYEAFSKIAEEEGYHNIALLYNAVSAAENIHARNHKAVIEDAGATTPIITPEFNVKTTKENLNDDINGEAYEAKTMYPNFLKTAEIADNQIAHLSLTYAMKTELKHKFFFEQALGDINSNTLNSLLSKYFVCPACGNTYTNAPKHCDFSLTDRDKFIVFQ